FQPSVTVEAPLFDPKDAKKSKSEVTSDVANTSAKKAKSPLKFDLGFKLTGAETDSDIITGEGILNWIYGGDGKDTITGGDWLNVIFAKKGDDTVDASNSFFAYIEGGDGDDKITGPNNPYAMGAIIFGDELSIGSLNPL